jgi:hypothetical protein
MDWDRLTLYSRKRRQRVSKENLMASAVTKTKEKKVDFYGVRVPESTKIACDALIGSAIVAETQYTIESGPNKDKVEQYTVEIKRDQLDELLGEGNEPASELGTINDKGSLLVPFTNLEAKDYSGALALVGGVESDVWKMFNRSFNMARRQVVRLNIVERLEGPQKAINSAVQAFINMGFSQEEAEAAVANVRAKLGE